MKKKGIPIPKIGALAEAQRQASATSQPSETN
jgi:hypothetical protein